MSKKHGVSSSSSVPFRRGLFTKLLLAFATVVLIMGILVTWLAGQATREEFYLYVTSFGQRQAERLAPIFAAYYLEAGSWEGLQEALLYQQPANAREPMGHPPRPWTSGDSSSLAGVWEMMGMQVLVADSQGKIISDSGNELLGAQLDSDDLAEGASIWIEGKLAGTVLVTAGALSGSQSDTFLQEVNQATLLAALIAGLIALILGGIITWGITHPMRELTQATHAITTGDLSQRVSIQSKDEIGDLAAAFNQMAEALERAEILRRQMTADIAHELRTPLSVIQGNVEALQDGIFPLTAESLAPIQAKTELLSRLVEDLRNLAMAEAGQLPLDREPIDLTELANGAVIAFQATASAKDISLQVNGEKDLPPAHADPQRIEQVLTNLLSNALRYSPENGVVTIRVTASEPGVLTTWVVDSGPGIPLEAQSNVFERFYRVDQGRARDQYGGSGLGLAVARSLVKAHGGNIGVKSVPGKGAAFWFTLPIAKTAQ